MVVEAFAKFDNLQQRGYEKQNPVDVQPLENPPIVLDIPIDQARHEAIMDSMITKASTPLFEGSSTSMLSAMLTLLKLKTIHGLSNVFMDELYSLLQKKLLPKGNKIQLTKPLNWLKKLV